MKPTVTMIVAALLFVAADKPPEAKKDPQAAVEPRSGPGAGQKLLEKMVGEWDVAKAFYPRSGDPVRGQGRCKQTMIHAGRFLQSEFEFGQGAAKTTGLGLIGFEPGSGAFTSVWTDSRQTQMSMRRSRDAFDGESIVLYSRSLDESKETRRSRTVTRLEDGGGKIVHRQFALAADGSERLMMELVMTRRAGAGKAGE